MANIALEEKLESEFGDFGIDIEGNLVVLGKLSELCTAYSLEPEDMVAKWVSFAYKLKNLQDINPDTLIDFEKKQLTKQDKSGANKKKTPASKPNTYTAATIGNIIKEEEDEDDMLQGYATTPQNKSKIASVKRLHTTPEDGINKRMASLTRTPVAFSPASLSPAITTPSAKYEARQTRGEVVAAYGISQGTGITWKGSGNKVSVRHFDGVSNVQSSYKYMFQKLQDKANVLNEIITTLTQQMKEVLMLDEYESVAEQGQEETTVAGRICCDSVGRMNSKSVLLEGSRETSNGQRCQLDLSDMNNYSLFPGQVVAIQGKNPSGEKIYAKSLYPGNKLPFYCNAKKDTTIDEGQFTVYVSSGPYATFENNISYTPLEDMLKSIKEERPDVFIMIGPFVDSKQLCIEKAEIDEDFDALFTHCYKSIASAIEGTSTTVIMIPSQRDVFHDYVFPQPPFEIKDKTMQSPQIVLMPDPCTIMINDVCLGVTSTDILFHLGAQEVASFSVRSDRLGRLVEHLLLQQCYYPLQPPSEEVNMDYEKFEEFCFMPVSPDVLIVPSELRYFVKESMGCLTVNPGRLVKGQTGGTYAKLLIKPKKVTNIDQSPVVAGSRAQIIRV